MDQQTDPFGRDHPRPDRLASARCSEAGTPDRACATPGTLFTPRSRVQSAVWAPSSQHDADWNTGVWVWTWGWLRTDPSLQDITDVPAPALWANGYGDRAPLLPDDWSTAAPISAPALFSTELGTKDPANGGIRQEQDLTTLRSFWRIRPEDDHSSSISNRDARSPFVVGATPPS